MGQIWLTPTARESLTLIQAPSSSVRTETTIAVHRRSGTLSDSSITMLTGAVTIKTRRKRRTAVYLTLYWASEMPEMYTGNLEFG
ncbi:hypothetical protein AArcS_0342 [Natranaeroarchaeum sulfidigenes]|uniref:Uncharacterized protein n=1 Tax=Natranaeroarchaeum sulfidigenes TaxID=2784880 RepID=A0A897MME9_9EURY|nr:hypothetical protein AArcS_0342 [Natranaeroarchaeum sulfidigenes]